MSLGIMYDPLLSPWKIRWVAVSWSWWSLVIGRVVVYSLPRL